MESTVLSVGKSVLDGALGYAQSAAAEEVALQLGIQRDQAFIKDELEMMQAFLMAAHEERDENKVIKTWVKQVRDVAYDVEDCLQDFAVRLAKPSWWRLPCTLLDRRQVAKQMKDLRAKVEDVSLRNVRYRLIKGSRSKPSAAAGQSSIADATKFGIEEARRQQEAAKVDLVQLIKEEDKNLKVIAVWGTSGVLGQTSVIKEAYENHQIKERFGCRAWVRVVHPFDPKEFLASILRQFKKNSLEAIGKTQDGATAMANFLVAMEKMGHAELAHEFSRHANVKSCLIVLTGLSNFEDWDWILTYVPNKKNGSRIIVSTGNGEIASLCVGQERFVSELKQSSHDQTIFAFYEKGSLNGQDSTKHGFASNTTTTCSNNSTLSTNEILVEKYNFADGKNLVGKSLTAISMMAAAMEESRLIGREKEKDDIINLILKKASQQFQVISMWGMGGLGKTTLVKDIYQSKELSGTFQKRACVTVMRPFVLEELLRSLVTQLDEESFRKKETTLGIEKLNEGSFRKIEKLREKLDRLLENKICLIVVDDISSTAEWDQIIQHFEKMEMSSRVIVTTRLETIAKYCSPKENIYNLKRLEDNDACDLFTLKVFKKITDLEKQFPELAKEAKSILKKCDGLPLAIVSIGGFLANHPKTVVEWRKLNEHISAELEMNPELETIRTVLLKSYDGLPYHLKSCFLYLSIFPEDYKISRKRLVQRWTAEGYAREVRSKSAEEIADNYYMELISRSMILPAEQSVTIGKGIDSCQVHDLLREISISKSKEENIVFRLEEGCSSNTQGAIRHLAISSNWEGHDTEMESIVDMSRIRSLTVFGKWKHYFISKKMRLLRVLDLQNSSGLFDHHLEYIGKFIHLSYISLRGCNTISHLPNSFGNLRQLQTLDIKGTGIIKLPKSMTKLRKLNYLRAGREPEDEDCMETLICLLICMPMLICLACLLHPMLRDDDDDDVNRRDMCNLCSLVVPAIVMGLDTHGVAVPRGIRKLRTLHTLGVVNIARGKSIVKDIKRLTRLRKLGVNGVNKENSPELCSAVAKLSRLESLYVRSKGEPGLQGCLDGVFSPPENLRSLKMYGNLVKLPEWIQGLKNLEKLTLRSSNILELDLHATVQVLGKLPNLTILRLLETSFQGEELRFQFHREAFPSLMVLQLRYLDNLRSVEFEEGAAPELARLQFSAWDKKTTVGLLSVKELNVQSVNAGLFSGLQSLPSLKEFTLDKGKYEDAFVEDLRTQLANNGNRPVLKRL